MARLRSTRSRYQVPCPITETCGPPLPKGFCRIALSLRVEHADVSHQHRARHRLRNVELVAPGATDRDIGAGPSRARLDARDDLAVRRKHEDMAERGVADEQAAGGVHGYAVGAARPEHEAEAANLGDA